MNQQGENTNELQSDADVRTILLKMQQQLTYLERKIDALINQSAARPPERSMERRPERSPERSEGRYEKKPFNKSFQPSFGGKPKTYGEKKFGAPFNNGKPGYDKKKKVFVPRARAQ